MAYRVDAEAGGLEGYTDYFVDQSALVFSTLSIHLATTFKLFNVRSQ